MELQDIWGAGTSEELNECRSLKPTVIGSIRHVVKASNLRKFCIDLNVWYVSWYKVRFVY